MGLSHQTAELVCMLQHVVTESLIIRLVFALI